MRSPWHGDVQATRIGRGVASGTVQPRSEHHVVQCAQMASTQVRQTLQGNIVFCYNIRNIRCSGRLFV